MSVPSPPIPTPPGTLGEAQSPATSLRCEAGQLLALWKMVRVDVIAALPRVPFDFDGGPSLAGRVRGAFGTALHALSADRSASLALQLCFGQLPLWRPRSRVPRPFVISAERHGGEIAATLTLFGRVDVDLDRLIDAFLLAFGLGISVDSRSGARRVPLQVVEASWTMTRSIEPVRWSRHATLLFRTPVSIGPKGELSRAWDNLVVSLVERVSGMALWQGIELPCDLGMWRRTSRDLCFDDDDLRPEAWERRSGRDGGGVRAMAGYTGRLVIIDPPPDLFPYLALGEKTFVGGQTAIGLGRYDLLT